MPKFRQDIVYLISFVVISLTVTGYFVGLGAPMNSGAAQRPTTRTNTSTEQTHTRGGTVIPATHYSRMPRATRQRTAAWRTSLAHLKSNFDPLAEVKISPEQKISALADRSRNRAFNGAPPTIPHPVDQTSAQACMACHGDGVKTKTLRISRMSHQFLANCTQCHVGNIPRHATAALFRENTFVGMPAPTAGPRAYHGAPPQIPHSTWMRTHCLSCHGFSGRHGLRTTHPWRINCQQCHAPSLKLDGALPVMEPRFLPAPKVQSSGRE